jgi:GntR family transcriptional regulator
MILFHLATHSGIPPYLQIIKQVKHALQIGQLKQGDQLPTVKEAVRMIAVNPNTVVKAYKELENLRLVEGRAGLGTFVSAASIGPPPDTQVALNGKLVRWVAEATKAGLDEESIEALFYMTLRNKRKEYKSNAAK